MSDRPAWYLLPVRLFLGLTFVYAGFQKLADPGFFRARSPSYIGSQLTGFARSSPLRPLLLAAARHPSLVGWTTSVVEIAVGLLLLAGLFTRIAAGVAAVVSLLLFLSTSWDVYPYFLGADLPFLVLALTLALAGSRDPWCLDWMIGRARGATSSPAGADTSRRDMLAGLAAVTGATVGVIGISRLVAGLRNEPAPKAAPALPATTSTTSPAPTPTASGSPAATTSPPTSSPPPASVPLAGLDEVQAQGKNVTLADGSELILVAAGKEVLGYSAVCTHASCTVGFDPQRRLIVCPCHGARYDPATGDVVRGPARFPLEPVSVEVRNGRVFLA